MNHLSGFDVPRFLKAAGIKEIYGLSLPRLNELVVSGAVRSIKFGRAKQSGRLYSSSDVEHSLERMSVGKLPKKMAQVMTAGGASRKLAGGQQ